MLFWERANMEHMIYMTSHIAFSESENNLKYNSLRNSQGFNYNALSETDGV